MKSLACIAFMLLADFSCQQPNKIKAISEKSFQKMHLIIERSAISTVKVRMQEFINEFQVPLTASLLQDGKYQGESPYDDYGYKHVISFKVDQGNFSDIQYNELKENGHGKVSDTSYCRRMNAAVPGSAPNISYPNYIHQVERNKNFNNIDAVTGATYSKYRLQLAAIRAISNGPLKQ